MRTRLPAAVAAVAAVVGVLAMAAGATAKPSHTARHSITIHAQPNPDQVGDPVVIFGRLFGPHSGGKVVALWHRLAGHAGFTRVGSVRTDSRGFYLFVRAPGVVDTNRFWFVRSDGARSRTIRERVIAEVTASGPATALTNQPVAITGHVTPNHAGARVFLQRQVSADTDQWKTIDSGRIGPGSNYRIVHRFRIADSYTLRTVFRGDRRNVGAQSTSFDTVVQQAQNPNLTITTSADPIDVGQSTTLAGKVAGAGAGTPVTLLARPYNGSFTPVAMTVTDAGGGYSFTETPQHNTVYRVQSLGKSSAQLFEAVRDVLTIQASPTTLQTGQTLTVSGTVTPNKSGHPIELQLLGNDGSYHTIQFATVNGATYQFNHVVQSPGRKTYRTLIDGGPVNAGGHSPSVTVTVTPPPPTA